MLWKFGLGNLWDIQLLVMLQEWQNPVMAALSSVKLTTFDTSLYENSHLVKVLPMSMA
uniref:Uncharacterized protein n=1 Tax=Rhizophora mucronata TaxID=61149 RepID=A0A2P2N3R9_RHIMU